jgi:flavin-dependent dehydrogenase
MSMGVWIRADLDPPRMMRNAKSTMSEQFDAVILGGGPAGSTAATLLAQQGLRVVVIEKDHFPRFHIGESLLPASVEIFDRMGVHGQIRSQFIRKPGGKWLYGSAEVPGDFSQSGGNAKFRNNPYAYLVERSVFDKILIDRAADVGADVRFGTDAVELIRQEGRVVGVSCIDDDGNHSEVRGRIVIDATGLRATIPSRLRLRKLTQPHRMGIYAQYAAKPTREDVKAGWFVGQMFYDGWTWLLRLPGDRFSVGVVLSVDRFRSSRMTPTEVLERLVSENELLNSGMVEDRRRISDVMVTGNMGSTSAALCGDGWVAVGDAAFFIDPCYSSGVHVAMKSAETVADIVAAQSMDRPVPQSAFRQYEKQMRNHEHTVHNMVESFYIASRNTSVQKMITSLNGGYFSRKFVTFVGGDFDQNPYYIARIRFYSKVCASVFGNDPQRAPETHPEYLHAAPHGEHLAEPVPNRVDTRQLQ